MTLFWYVLSACGPEKSQDFSLGQVMEPSDSNDSVFDSGFEDTGIDQESGELETGFDDTGSFDTGQSPVRLGPMGELIQTIELGHNGDGYGYRVAGLGDSNNDGRHEFALAAPTLVLPEFNAVAGGLSIFQADPQAVELSATDQIGEIISDQSYAYFAQWITACDVDQRWSIRVVCWCSKLHC